jgi:transposase
MNTKITATHEQVDDIPAILAQLKKMRVAPLLDKHFPTNGNWQGLSLGWVTVVWLTYILSEGDHRLSHVEPWVTAHQRTLRRCVGRLLRPRDFNDDRLATVLDYLGIEEHWVAFERELNEGVIRVYDLRPHTARVDSTTASAFVSPEGLFQLGHSKDHRPDLPQLKISMAVLDPLGLPLTTTIVAGNTADDPLYLPEIAKVRKIAQITGLTYIGDCKMAAIGTRADLVAQGDHYLCPLSAKQVPAAELDRWLAPVFDGRLAPAAIRLLHVDRETDDTDEPVAVGFEYTLEQRGVDQAKKVHHWSERRLIVRSLRLAASQEQSVRARVAHAVTDIKALDERKQGKKVLQDEAAAQQAAEAILVTYRVEGLVHITVRTETHAHVKRRYGARPASIVRSTRVRVQAASDEARVAAAAQRLGWRVYATNHSAAELSLQQAVAAYRSEYLIEQGFGRFKGRSLSLQPLYLHYEHRIIGLVYLLSIALRVLVLMQFIVRRTLQQAGAKLKAIYRGQPGRQTAKPTTEMLLRIFRGITLSRITLQGKTYDYLTPLNETQQRILELLEMPLDIYDKLVT